MCHSWTFQNTYSISAISARTPRWLSNETWRHVVWKSTWIVWVRKCSAAYWLPFVGGSVQYGQRGGRPTVARDATSVLVTHRAFLNADPAEVKFLHKPGLSEVGKISPTSNKTKKGTENQNVSQTTRTHTTREATWASSSYFILCTVGSMWTYALTNDSVLLLPYGSESR